jgi:hypothetical protein
MLELNLLFIVIILFIFILLLILCLLTTLVLPSTLILFIIGSLKRDRMISTSGSAYLKKASHLLLPEELP